MVNKTSEWITIPNCQRCGRSWARGDFICCFKDETYDYNYLCITCFRELDDSTDEHPAYIVGYNHEDYKPGEDEEE